jgi:drug/metabolite transporter (DMT)-like permease
MTNLSTKTVGIILTVVAFSFTALGDVSSKSLASYHNVFAVGLYLNYFTIAFLIPIIMHQGGFKKAFTTDSLKFHILRSFFMLGVYVCIIYALWKLPITTAYTIIFTSPFMLNIIALIFLKEKISFYRWLAIIFAFVGVLIALRPGLIPLNSGAITAIGCALFLACAITSVKFISAKDKWLSFICYPMLIQTPVLAILTYWQGSSILPPLEGVSLLWLLIGGGAFCMGLSLLPQAVKRIDASIFGALMYIVFIWGTIYGYFIFNNVPDLWTLLGAVIIIASGLFLIYREKIEDSKILELEEKHDSTSR